MKRYLRPIRSIAWVTFTEIIRDKLLYNIGLISLGLFGMAMLASRLSISRQDRLVIDLGILAVLLSCSMVGTLAGAAMIGREFERRTVWVALARPISRMQFMIGKFAGLALVIALNWALLCGALLGVLRIVSPEIGSSTLLGPTLAWALVFTLLHAWVVGGLAVFFSSFTTTSLSVIFTIGFALAGHSITALRLFLAKGSSQVRAVVETLLTLFPNLEHFDLGLSVTYGLPIEGARILTAFAYACVWMTFLISLSGLLIQRRGDS